LIFLPFPGPGLTCPQENGPVLTAIRAGPKILLTASGVLLKYALGSTANCALAAARLLLFYFGPVQAASLPLQIYTFRINHLQVSPLATSFFSDSCMFAGGVWVPQGRADLKDQLNFAIQTVERE
jgi:hypothetical protein